MASEGRPAPAVPEPPSSSSSSSVWAGHLWTVGPKLLRLVWPLEAPPSSPWSLEVEDAASRVRLSGRLQAVPGSEALVLLVHGLGGCADSPYMLALASRAADLGLASLRLNQRGADRRGEDFYHAGLIEDLSAALASPELASYERLYVLGCSLGGHTVLRWAVHEAAAHPRVRAVAVLCAPLDLAAASDAFSKNLLWIYRRYLLAGMVDVYRQVAARRPVPLPVAAAERIRTLWEWDDRIVAARFGFGGAEDYYRRMSVGPHLTALGVRTLFVGSSGDPMVPAAAVLPSLVGAPPTLEVRWTPRGGHLGFPRDLDLGLGPSVGLEAQVLGWLMAQG